MALNFPALALVIASLSLVVSALSFFFGRRDKTADVIKGLRSEIASSQKVAMDRMETTFNQRISNLEVLGAERHSINVTSLANLSEKLARVDETIKNIPNHRDIDGLQNTISGLTSQVSRLEGALEANTRMTERINDFLMSGGRSS